MHDRAWRVAVAGVLGAVVLVGLDSSASGAAASAPAVTVESPTYLPADLPGGFGANPVRFVRRPRGYTLTAMAHDTTYTVDVRTRKRGDRSIKQDRLASLAVRTAVRPNGRVRWRDRVARVAITAVGPEGHTRRGLQTIGKRMVVVPRSVLDELTSASRANRSRSVELSPIEFENADVSLTQVLHGRLGRAGIAITTPRETGGTGVCFGCDQVSWFTGWRQDGTTYSLVAVPPNTTVERTKGVQTERVFDPAAGSDLVLLSTERRDHPRVTFSVAGQPPVRLAIQETTL